MVKCSSQFTYGNLIGLKIMKQCIRYFVRSSIMSCLAIKQKYNTHILLKMNVSFDFEMLTDVQEFSRRYRNTAHSAVKMGVRVHYREHRRWWKWYHIGQLRATHRKTKLCHNVSIALDEVFVDLYHVFDCKDITMACTTDELIFYQVCHALASKTVVRYSRE